jgi:hypothetical protein
VLPLKKAAVEIDKRFVEYLELSDSVTGRIIEVLRRAAFRAIADKSQKVGLQQLQYVGARMPPLHSTAAYLDTILRFLPLWQRSRTEPARRA